MASTTTCEVPGATSATTSPGTRLPSTVSETPLPGPCRVTVISYQVPLNKRLAENPDQADGMAGAIRSPAWVGLIPKIHWVTATYIHAAAPVSQALRPKPYWGWAGPQMFWQ